MWLRDQMWGFFFISPWIIGLLLFTLVPMVLSLLMSFTSYEVITPPKWIGIGNFISMVSEDPLIAKALYNTIYYTIFYIPLNITICLLMASLLNSKVRGVSLFRTLIYIPNIVPVVALAMIWLIVLNPQYGILNWFLRIFGLQGPEWFGSTTWSKPAIILMNLYKAGFTTLMFVAALQNVPDELYEAAALDGADRARRFVHVTLPMISPVILFSMVMGMIGSFQLFSEAWITTKGGPLNSTLFYGVYLYKKAFDLLQMGYAAAMAWVLFMIILVLTLLQLRISGSWVYYEGGEK